MERKWIILLVVVLLVVACGSAGCAKTVSKLKVLKAGDAVADAASTYTDSDTTQENQMYAYELLGEKGTVYNIHFEGNGPVDLMILNPENYYRYDRALDGNSEGSIRGQLYLNKKEADIKFTQPDDQQYRFIIDNTYLMTNGANAGRSVAYTVTIS
ncbi:hypothetical protein R6Y95_06095 [Methanoculleus palmolei]|uniref:Lipoprotein n=1 Tax=Methanoculleus palmolei TaxID=72612 RepID=A0ABD8A675_9EURY|nr:hypothetical protein R6Y95_06095 [Methanoculleus palmolei]